MLELLLVFAGEQGPVGVRGPGRPRARTRSTSHRKAHSNSCLQPSVVEFWSVLAE